MIPEHNNTKTGYDNTKTENIKHKDNIKNVKHIPFIYVFSHWLIGYLGYYNKLFIVLFFVYQLYQYSINRRFYLLPYCKYDNKSRMEGNSLQHTISKLKQGLYGYIIAYLCNLLCNKFFK